MNQRNNRDKDGFYEVMDEYYGKTTEVKHKSPTKRLIKMKNTVSDHKKLHNDNFSKQGYSQTYCVAPGKTYVIEPIGGELNYNLAEKNPLKFYEQVFN